VVCGAPIACADGKADDERGIEVPVGCAIEEGFRLSTFRDDFPLNCGGACPAGVVPVLANPKLDEGFGFACTSCLVMRLGGSRKVGLGSPVCDDAGALLLGSICAEGCATSPSLGSILSALGCVCIPILLNRLESPCRDGGSNPALYDGIVSLSLHYRQ